MKTITIRFVFDDRRFPVDKLMREFTYIFDQNFRHLSEHDCYSRYFILPTFNHGKVMFFHSGEKPNMKMLNLFSYWRSIGLVDYFICCDPERVPTKYRRWHLAGDCFGVVESCRTLDNDRHDRHVHVYKVMARKRIA